MQNTIPIFFKVSKDKKNITSFLSFFWNREDFIG